MIPRGPLIGHNVCSFLLLKKVSYCIGSLTYSYKNLCLKYFRRCIHRLVLNSEYSPVCGPSTRRYLAPQRVFLLPIETVMSRVADCISQHCISQHCISQMYLGYEQWLTPPAVRFRFVGRVVDWNIFNPPTGSLMTRFAHTCGRS